MWKMRRVCWVLWIRLLELRPTRLRFYGLALLVRFPSWFVMVLVQVDGLTPEGVSYSGGRTNVQFKGQGGAGYRGVAGHWTRDGFGVGGGWREGGGCGAQ